MPRNLDKRVEILFPVEDEALKEEVIDILDIQLRDNAKARIMQPDGSFFHLNKHGKDRLNSQEYFCNAALAVSAGRKHAARSSRCFEPLIHEEEEDS